MPCGSFCLIYGLDEPERCFAISMGALEIKRPGSRNGRVAQGQCHKRLPVFTAGKREDKTGQLGRWRLHDITPTPPPPQYGLWVNLTNRLCHLYLTKHSSFNLRLK